MNDLIKRNSELEQENIQLKKRAEKAEQTLLEIQAAWKTITRIMRCYS
jgi:hypothetical protein